jgi:predicted HNH restriction endonuclease
MSQTCTVKTKIEDIAFICANCHRALHSLTVKEKRWIKPYEIKKITTA